MRLAATLLALSLFSNPAFAASGPQPTHIPGYKAEFDEPRRPAADIAKASHFLETVSLKWTRQNKCGTCHTNLAHIMAEPFLEGRDAAAEKEIRDSLFDFLASYNPNVDEVPPEKRRANNNILWNRLIIAGTFAMSDGEAGLPQDPRTVARFEQIWTMQNPDGSFNYPRKALPFLEDDAHYVMTMTAIAASYMPAEHYKSPVNAAGLKKLHGYLAATPAKDQHGELVLMRASMKAPELMSAEKRAELIARTLKLQRPDGGWSTATLGNWMREGDIPNRKDGPSDGYGTGFVLYTLCKSGVPASSPAVRNGMAWLEANQRESGRWYTASLWADDMQHYVSTIGTAYAVMALKECAKA